MTRVSGSDFLFDSSHFVPSAEPEAEESRFFSVTGGMQRVPEQLLSKAEAAGASVLLGRTITSVEIFEGDVVNICHHATTDNQQGASECAEYDAAIVTLPLPTLEQVHFSPPLGRSKQRAIRTTEYDEATKVAIRFAVETPAWNESLFPQGSRVESDLDARQLYFLPNSVVMSYTWGVDAERLAAMTPDMRIERVVRDVARLTGQDATQLLKKVTHTASKSWKNDPAFGAPSPCTLRATTLTITAASLLMTTTLRQQRLTACIVQYASPGSIRTLGATPGSRPASSV